MEGYEIKKNRRNVFEKIEGQKIDVLGFIERVLLLNYVRYTAEDLMTLEKVLDQMVDEKCFTEERFLEICKRVELSPDIMETLENFRKDGLYGYFCGGSELCVIDDEELESLFDYYTEKFNGR